MLPILVEPNLDDMLSAVLMVTQPSTLGVILLEYIFHSLYVAKTISWKEIGRLYSTPSPDIQLSHEHMLIRDMLSYLKSVELVVVLYSNNFALSDFHVS